MCDVLRQNKNSRNRKHLLLLLQYHFICITNTLLKYAFILTSHFLIENYKDSSKTYTFMILLSAKTLNTPRSLLKNSPIGRMLQEILSFLSYRYLWNILYSEELFQLACCQFLHQTKRVAIET
jgi:hypothetical protein